MHVMIDLETWGTKPGCDIRSIGACLFDPRTGVISDNTFYIATDSGDTSPLYRDPDTVAWWAEQTDEAQAAFANPYETRAALIKFTNWLLDISPEPFSTKGCEMPIWAHGPQFDISILAAAYDAHVMQPPWSYQSPRDTRTIMEAAGVCTKSGLEMFRTGTYHNALDDAITQAKAVCAAYKALRLCDGKY